MLKWSEVTQSCPTLRNPMDYSPTGSSLQEILQARVLEWGAISFPRGSSQPRVRTWVSHIPGRHFNLWDDASHIHLSKAQVQNVFIRNCINQETGHTQVM